MPRGCKARSKLECIAIGCDRFIVRPLIKQRVAKIAVRLGQGFVQRNGSAARGDGFTEFSGLPECCTEIAARLGITRPECYRLPVSRDGFFQVALAMKKTAEIFVRLGIVRLEGDGLAARGDGVIHSPDGFQCDTEILMGFGVVRLFRNGLAKPLHSLGVFACLSRDDPEEM